MNISKQQNRILISTLQDPKVHGVGSTHSSASPNFLEQGVAALSSLNDNQEVAAVQEFPRHRRGYPSLDTTYWRIMQLESNTIDATDVVVLGDSDWSIFMSGESRIPHDAQYNETQETSTSLLLEKNLDQAIAGTKDREESVPNLYHVFGP